MNLLISNSRASYYVGGTEVVSLKQSIELARLGHEIIELVRATDKPTEYFEEFVAMVQHESLPITIEELKVDSPEGNGSSWTLWNSEALAFGRDATPSYLKHLRDGIDLCVSHLVTDSLFVPNQAPSALHLHGTPNESDMLIDSAMVVNGDNCVAHSDSIKEWWSSKYPDKRYRTFRNGVDTSEFYADPYTSRPIDVLYVGRFLEHKGIDDVLNAVDRDFRVVIAGSGRYEQEIRRIIAERGLNNTELVIRPSNTELKDLYAKSKVFTCPSKGKEGVLTTMLEAAASGCAILTARGSGMTDLIMDRENGLLVDPGNVTQIANGITKLLHNDQDRMTLAANVQNEILQNWSWTAKGKELEGLYEDITKDK